VSVSNANAGAAPVRVDAARNYCGWRIAWRRDRRQRHIHPADASDIRSRALTDGFLEASDLRVLD